MHGVNEMMLSVVMVVEQAPHRMNDVSIVDKHEEHFHACLCLCHHLSPCPFRSRREFARYTRSPGFAF